MRAGDLVDLVLAGRVTVKDRQIEVTDATATGSDRLDDTLAAIGTLKASTVQSWMQGTVPGIGLQFLSRLEEQHVVQVGDGRRTARAPRITLVDPARRAEVQARVDRVARGESAGQEDRALAGLVYACGLDAHLYREVRGRTFRRQLARLGEQQVAAAAVRAALAAADTALAEAVARVIADGVEQLNRELVRLLRYEYEFVILPGHQTGHHHSSGSGHHGGGSGHHGGIDAGGGHHG